MTPPLIGMLHDRDLQQAMTRQVNKLANSGNLLAILEVLDDRQLIQNDAQRFTMALHEYARLAQEKNEISDHLKKRKNFGGNIGRQVAMIFSSILSVIIITIYIVMRITRGF
ncbi:MAG: hypothetical protein HY052_08360 [Proteobacteria bacterium]|nr:hypothetical protein [Pseudomonadota bacterium]